MPPEINEGKSIQFYGKPDNRAVVFLRPYIPSPEKTTNEYSLYLTTGRVVEQWHTGTMTDRVPELSATSGRGRFILNPQDAFEANIVSGDKIELSSRYGKVQGFADISENESPGTVFASFYDSKFLINLMVSDHYDPVSKEPEYKVTAVSLKKVSSNT